MHKNATKCNKTLSKWCENKHGASKIIDTFETYQGSSWHKNEIQMIRRGHYSSNNFQDSTKRKSTKKKTLCYLPGVLFFNAFELGAESGNQVFSNEGALRSIAEVFSTRNCILSK
jgi:hypothetical protein